MFFGQSGEASWWRVCYQWGLPSLVYNVFHQCFKCWWQLSPLLNYATKPIVHNTFNHGLPRDVNYPGQTVKTEYTEATTLSYTMDTILPGLV